MTVVWTHRMGGTTWGYTCIDHTDGRPSGEAYVKFNNEADAITARDRKNKAEMGSRWIDVMPATLAEMQAAGGADAMRYPDASYAGCVFMKGLPFRLDPADVRTPWFFGGMVPHCTCTPIHLRAGPADSNRN